MNRPGRAAKAAPHMASPDPGGSPWVPPCCKRGLSSAGEIGSCASEGRCSYLSWAASWEQVTGIRGGQREGKKPKGFACRSSSAALSVQHHSQSPAPGSADQGAAFGQRDLGTAGGIWGRQSRELGAQGCLKGHSQAQTQKKKIICLIW